MRPIYHLDSTNLFYTSIIHNHISHRAFITRPSFFDPGRAVSLFLSVVISRWPVPKGRDESVFVRNVKTCRLKNNSLHISWPLGGRGSHVKYAMATVRRTLPIVRKREITSFEEHLWHLNNSRNYILDIHANINTKNTQKLINDTFDSTVALGNAF